jgi:hypothetical protein
MPDVKISALPAATVPLAGTEVLPIVQSSTTRQVSVANLTAGRAISASSVTNSALTSGRVTYATTAGLLTDSSTFQFNSNGLGIGAAPNLSPGSPYFNLNVGGGGGGGIISSGDDTYFTSNLYITGGANYFAVTGPAYGSYYNQSNGNHLWLSSTAAGAGGTVATVTEKMRISSIGAVSIGTSSASAEVHVLSAQGNNGYGGSADTGMVLIESTGGPTSGGDLNASFVAKNYYGFGQIMQWANMGMRIGSRGTANGGAGEVVFTYGSDSEGMRINSSGIISMSAYGAGAATFSAAGVISSVSDETWKTKDGVPTNTDAMLQKLEPGYWFYNEEKASTFGEERQLGFYAQNVHEAIGEEAAPTPQEGKPWGYHDRSVLAVAVMSLKNALATIEELKQRITALENK